VRCVNNKCQRFQRVYSSLPTENEYHNCRFCGTRQPVSAFVDPRTNRALRGYDATELGEKIQELKKFLSLHGRPGHWTYDRRQQALSAASSKFGGASKSAGLTGQKGSFAQVLVPDDVQVGDVLEIRAGGRAISVTVHDIEGGAHASSAPASRREATPEPVGAAPAGFVMQQCDQ